MANDPRVNWSPANPVGIADLNAAQERWWSGRVFDVAELDEGDAGVLVATETGGAWTISTAWHAVPLSHTWNNPDLHCLAQGPDGPRHYYAAGVGGVIYEADPSQPSPLLAWIEVTEALPFAQQATAARPMPPERVYDLVVAREHRLIVAATTQGLYWARIPPLPPWWCVLNRRRAALRWRRAQEPALGQGGYYSVALGSAAADGVSLPKGGTRSRDLTVIAGGLSRGVFVGRWVQGDLVLEAATVTDESGNDISAVQRESSGGPTAVATCEGLPRHAYSVTATAQSDGDGRIQAVLYSADGGLNWRRLGTDVKLGSETKTLSEVAGSQGAGAAPNNCIAVDPSAHGVVAIGWQYGTFITPQGGNHWIHVPDSVHHADVHVLRFKRPDAAGRRHLYIGSDGGLARICVDDVLGLQPVVAESRYNVNLAALQCYCTDASRQFFGTSSVAPDGSGRMALGLHDNGNIEGQLGGPGTPWRQIEAGDGGVNSLLADGTLLRQLKAAAARMATFVPPGGYTDVGVAPLLSPSPGDPAGLMFPIHDPVRAPIYRQKQGLPMLAVGYRQWDVYGLFRDPQATVHHWERLGGVASDVGMSAIASHDGVSVLIGSLDARFFLLDSATGNLQPMPVNWPSSPAGNLAVKGFIRRIVTLNGADGYAIASPAARGVFPVLRREGAGWVPARADGLPPDAPLYGLEAVVDGNGQAVLFVATDDNVFLSEDRGDRWVPASAGLPRRAHCGELRAGRFDGSTWLVMSTFGRSVWKANLGRFTGR